MLVLADEEGGEQMATGSRYNRIVARNECVQEPIERRLWRSVVWKALKDSALPVELNKHGADENLQDRESARLFLYSRNSAFREWREQVFDMAGLNPESILKEVVK